MSAELVTLYDTNFRDPAAALRTIADEIDRGEYGEVGCLAVALLADRLEVFAAGPDAEGPSAAVVLTAGAQKIVTAVVEHGVDDQP